MPAGRKTKPIALAKSREAIRRFLERPSLSAGGRVKDFPAGVVAFFAYAISHDAHHRGQICQLARQTGFALADEVTCRMWDWSKRQYSDNRQPDR